MQRNFLKNTVFILGLFLIAIITNSCDDDNMVSIVEPRRYTNDDVKSYADLFKVFWSVMDQRYSSFYEQSRMDGMNWDTVYNEYYPKFSALQTFGRATDDRGQIDTDRNKAIQYFKNIVNPIIDRHFFVKINMPFDNVGRLIATPFYGGMNNKEANGYDFETKLSYIKNWLTKDVTSQTYKELGSNNAGDKDSFTYLTGSIKSNPEICYLTYDQFSVFMSDARPYLDIRPSPHHKTVLQVSDIENSRELKAIGNILDRNKLKDLSIKILNQWNSFNTSQEIITFRTQVTQFMATEEISDAMVKSAKDIEVQLKKLIDFTSPDAYQSVLTPQTVPYIRWFIQQMNQHTNEGDDVRKIKLAASAILDRAPFYQNFLNPLHKGKIKKLILDLRDNGGGSVIDFQFFVERFVTQSTVWSYERIKEGNGRFDYTPWIPQKTRPHAFAMPSSIPIAILTDKGSVSMSEATTLLLKSQGSQVISIGDYSFGGLATVSGEQDEFNGGIVGKIAGNWFYFYMPLSSVKGPNGELIEGIGIKPDIYVEPPTDAEVKQMESAPATFKDRVMQAAVNYLSSK